MRSYSATTTISASPERIWAVLADVTRWPEWTPTMTSVEALGPRELSASARFRIVQPKLRPGVWSVTELNQNRNFTWEARSPGVRVVAYHVIAPTTPGAASVTLRVDFIGLIAPLVALAAGKLTQSYLETEAASLKERVERRRN